jgi:hypothetical protein
MRFIAIVLLSITILSVVLSMKVVQIPTREMNRFNGEKGACRLKLDAYTACLTEQGAQVVAFMDKSWKNLDTLSGSCEALRVAAVPSCLETKAKFLAERTLFGLALTDLSK